MKQENQNTICQTTITNIEMQSYNFIIYYAEELYESIAEFRHHHPLYQFYYVYEGTIHIEIDQTLVEINEKEILFLAPNVEHHVLYEPYNEKKYFAIIFDFVSNYKNNTNDLGGDRERIDILRELNNVKEKCYIISHKTFNALFILDLIRKEIEEKQIGWNTSVNMLLYNFFLKAIRHIFSYKANDIMPIGKHNFAFEATMYIHKNFQKDISLESVAKYLNISPRHVNRAYQVMFGTTFMKNLTKIRMEYAKDFLCYTDNSIEKISQLVGFSSPRNLYKLFKEVEGISIAKYRNLHTIPNRNLKVSIGSDNFSI